MNHPARWAFSPYDHRTHLLSDDHQPLCELQARCGHLLPKAAAVHDQPLSRKCIQCDLFSLADAYAPGGFSRQWQDNATEARCESRLLDPANNEHVYLELHLQCGRLRDNRFSWVVSLDTTRRLRDQLTEHLDTTQSTEADCPGCGTTHGVQRITGTSPTVQAGMCVACGLHGATTAVVNPVLSIVGLLPTPQLRTAALLAVLRTEVARRSGKGHTMTVTVCLPATEVISIDAMASVDTVVWWCRLCDHHGTATTRPTARSEGVEHLTTEHHATISAS